MENRKAPENGPIETLHKLLNVRDFVGVRFMVHMNKLVRNKRNELDQAQAICDVLIAAENQLPNGFMDYYGMLRVTRPGPVVLDDFKKLMKLLDGRHNRFPFNQEAAQYALQAWSILSKPHMKAKYDLTLMHHEKKKKKKKKKKSTRDCKRCHWKPSEDLKLREHVAVFGPQNWKYIADKIQGRTEKRCRLRWFNQLDPGINKKAFSDEEDSMLLAAHRELGTKWSSIAKFLHGRTDNAVKNRLHQLMKRKLKKQS